MRIDNGMTSPIYTSSPQPYEVITKEDTEPLQIKNAREVVKLLYGVGKAQVSRECLKGLMDDGYSYAEDIEGLIEDYIKAAKLLKDHGIDIFAPVTERKGATA